MTMSPFEPARQQQQAELQQLEQQQQQEEQQSSMESENSTVSFCNCADWIIQILILSLLQI